MFFDQEEYYCPNCGAILNDQAGFDPEDGSWECTECGTTLYGDDVYDGDDYPGVMWYCDNCGALLNKQSGFSDDCDNWECAECGYVNPISEDEIYESEEAYRNSRLDSYVGNDNNIGDGENDFVEEYYCPNCDELLNDQEDFDPDEEYWECTECGQRIEIIGGEVYEADNDSGYIKDSDYDNVIRDNTKQIRKNDRKRKRATSFFKFNWKAYIIFMFILVIGCFGGYKYLEYQNSITVGLSSADLIGDEYSSVNKYFQDVGFTDIHKKEKKDLGIDEIQKEYVVTDVAIRGEHEFSATSRYSKDAKVVITYHKVADINVPMSAKAAKKQDYKHVEKQFRDAGFINIHSEAEYDLINGWIVKENSVKSISVNGDKKFKDNDAYRPDSEVIITYHLLKNKEK